VGELLESIPALLRLLIESGAHLEGATWGGRANLFAFVVVALLAVLVSPFQFVAQLITAWVARRLGVGPRPFLPQTISPVRDVFLLLLFFIASVFTVWFTRL
jgi:hypothetical protein